MITNGHITAEDLAAIWQSSVDSGYSRPFLENTNSGFEAYGQAFAQLERVSQAIDTTTQAMFLMPFSGQSAPSAQEQTKANVTLTFQRTKRIDLPIKIDSNVWFDEVQQDWSDTGPVPYHTGRRYRLVTPLVFNPGETGPFTALAIAEFSGYGGNNPLADAINEFDQPGKGLSNKLATYSPKQDSLIAVNRADTPIPQHVGQYLVFEGGLNSGVVKRVMSYGPPNISASIGGTLFFESLATAQGDTTDTFIEGEVVAILVSSINVASGVFVKQAPGFSVFVLKGGSLSSATSGATVVGSSSGATLVADAVSDPILLASTDESWRMLDWANDLGFTVINSEQPLGGVAGFLDELAKERNVYRVSGETDDSFAERVHSLPDTVSPNAIRRAANRVLGPYGLSVCLREMGQRSFPGFYMDHDFFDYDFAKQPRRWNHVVMSYTDMRAYFFLGVPRLNWGEFGFAYDVGTHNAYDCSPALAFYDGFPRGNVRLYGGVRQAVETVKAAGVGFTLYQEVYGCR